MYFVPAGGVYVVPEVITSILILLRPPAAGAADVHVVPSLVRILPEVPGATT
jgi:hypothetical protein